MWFDVQAALAGIQAETKPDISPDPRAIRAICAISTPEPAPRIARIARIARPPVQKLEIGAADDALDAFEERAAIREHDGGQSRPEAEAAALHDAARAAGIAPAALRATWAQHPDAEIYLAHLSAAGPRTYGAMASELGWGMTRAWRAEARLRAAGLVTHGDLGAAYPKQSSGP